MKPIFFSKQADLRKWFEKYHDKKTELFVGFYKMKSGKPSITWSQSVDEALCFGWIDSIGRSINEESYSVRFTPRKATSNWSDINIKKVKDLKKQGLMHPEGLASFEKREKKPLQFASSFKKKFQANEKAWAFFTAQAPSYQKRLLHWVMSAKQETTQLNRLEKLISGSEAGQRI